MVYSEVLDIFANLALQAGVTYEQFMLNFKNAQLSDYAVRGSWKYGCDHHVSGTPTFYINGVESPASSEWAFDDWTVRKTMMNEKRVRRRVCVGAHLRVCMRLGVCLCRNIWTPSSLPTTRAPPTRSSATLARAPPTAASRPRCVCTTSAAAAKRQNLRVCLAIRWPRGRPSEPSKFEDAWSIPLVCSPRLVLFRVNHALLSNTSVI